MKDSAAIAICEAWSKADNAETIARIAAHALESLNQLVTMGDLDVSRGGRLDVDAYATFADGVVSQIKQAADEAGEAADMIQTARESYDRAIESMLA